MEESRHQSRKRFFCQIENQARGPFDLTELAAELRYGNINAETPTRFEFEEFWLPFSQRPEYALAKQIPLEEIAHHLESKDRVERDPSRQGTLTLIAVALVVLLTLVVISFMWSATNSARAPQGQASSNPPPADWTKTEENGFSIECPVVLRRVDEVKPEVISYRGMEHVAGFGVDLANVRGNYSVEEYNAELTVIESMWLNTLHADVSLNRPVKGDGYWGRDLFFTHTYGGRKFAGGLRVLAGNGKISAAWVTALSDKFKTEDIERYLKSFQLLR